MAAGFQVVLTAIPFVQQLWGTPGVLASAALLGLTDMDALTLSMCRLAAADGAGLAAAAIAVGILSNTLLKLTLAAVLGRERRSGAGPCPASPPWHSPSVSDVAHGPPDRALGVG